MQASFLSAAGLAFAFTADAAISQTPTYLHSGAATGGNFGSSAVVIGDYNNDGVEDVVVGSPLDNTNGFNAGRVTVLSGADGSTLTTKYGDAAGDNFGFSVCGLRDTNGDGVDDFMVGAPYGTTVNGTSGYARSFAGSSGAQLVNYVGAAAGDRFGYSCAWVAEIGATTRVVIGAPYHGAGDTGSAYLYTEAGALLHEFTGDLAGDHFGWAVGGGFVGVGVSSVIVGAPDFDNGGASAGRVKRFSATSFATLDTIMGATGGLRLGSSVAVVGDVNGDGNGDYVIGAPDSVNGNAYIISGLTGSTLVGISGSSASSHFGSSLAPAGDINGDGRFDFIVGEPDGDPSGLTDAGSAFVYGYSGGPQVLRTFNGTLAGGRLGLAVHGGLDVSGDGKSDFALGSPNTDIGGVNTGRVRLVSGSNSALLWSTEGPAAGDQLGACVRGVGDVNGDGVPDYAVGSPDAEHTYNILTITLTDEDAGKVVVYSGATGSALLTLYGSNDGDNFGFSVDGCGDVNKDGKADFIVGAPQMSTTNPSPGYARIYSGANGAVLFSFASVLNNDTFGYCVTGIGDVDNDTYPDICIGSPNASFYGLKAGKADAYSGKTGFYLWTAKNRIVNDQFGYSMAGLGGDVTGDGRPDVVMGAPFNDANGSNAGAAYIVNGANGTNFKTIYGDAASDDFGYSCAGPGDVNRDGLVDALVGAPYRDNFFAANGGVVKVIHAATGAVIQSYFGLGTADLLGSAVCGVGDVDNDGYADFAAGAPQWLIFSPAGPGYVEVVSGKANTLITRVNSLTTGTLSNSDRFGASIDGLGDIDGDKIPDLIVGAPWRPFPTFSGVAQVYSLRPAGVTFYGASTAGCDGAEFLTANRSPKINTSNFGYRCDKAPANSLGLLLASDSQSLTGSDPFGIGVTLYVDLFAATEVYGLDIFSDGAGFGACTTPLANNVSLIGLDYYVQALWAWSSCSLPPFGLSTSSAVKIVIQP